MGLRKLLSINTTDKEEKKLNRKSSSAISLTKSFSNWTNNKEKIKQHSNKRYSQPSPTISNASLQFTKKVNVNPFESNQPVTPSASMRDVNDVVTTLRNSGSSEAWSEDNYRTTSIIQEEEVYSASPVPYDSNKYEVSDDESPDATNTEDDYKELYTELQIVAAQLNAIDPNNAIEIKQRLNSVNNLLISTMDTTQQLELKIKQVVDNSKTIIIATTEENRELKSKIENSENEESLVLIDLNEEKNKIKAENDMLIKENNLLDTSYKTILNEFNELKEKFNQLQMNQNDIYSLFHQNIQQEELIKEIKTMMITIEESKKNNNNKEVLANEITEQYNARIKNLQAEHAEEKIKLEYGTTKIRDLMDKEHDKFVAQMKELRNEKDKETLELRTKLTEIENTNKSLETIVTETTKENKGLKQQLIDLETISKESVKNVIKENEKLEENLNDIQKIDQKKIQESEEIMHLHTKAQLGLIEYLEGEDDVIQAMAKFKKQLETNMREFNSTNTILSVTSS